MSQTYRDAEADGGALGPLIALGDLAVLVEGIRQRLNDPREVRGRAELAKDKAICIFSAETLCGRPRIASLVT